MEPIKLKGSGNGSCNVKVLSSRKHLPLPSQLGPDGLPRQTIAVHMRICADHDSKSCPYVLEIVKENANVSFKKKFCLYSFRTNF